MVLGVRLQVLGELPDASGGQRDLDLGAARVLLCALVFRDQLAFDFVLYCQTRLATIRGSLRTSLWRDIGEPCTGFPCAPGTNSAEPSERRSARALQCPGPSMTIACACPRV